MARKFSSIASEKTIQSPGVSTSSTDVILNDVNGLPSPPFTLVLSPDTVDEEIVTVTAVSGTTLTISRAEEGTNPAKSHPADRKARHMITARDLQEVHNHMEEQENVHGISDAAFLVYENDSQVLTNKTISGSSNTLINISQASVTGLTSDLASKATTAALANHEADTTNIHGILDTSALATKTYADNAATTVGSTASSALSAHEADSTSVHGITDTSKLAVFASASVGRKISVQATAPTSPAVGDIWFQVTGL